MKKNILLLALFFTNISLFAQIASQKIATSSNSFGYANLGQKQCYIRNDLNTIAFIFRNNPNISGAGNSGHLRYAISQNRGLTWVTPFLPNNGAGIGNINPQQAFLARYPNCFLFSNGVGVNNLHFGGLAATLNSSGSGWEGYVKMAIAPSIFTNLFTPVVEQEDYSMPQTAIFPQHISERVQGEFWATLYGDISNDTIYVLKGIYNTVNQAIDWQYNDKLVPIWDTLPNGLPKRYMPKIEFSPDGNKGYVSALGNITGGQTTGNIPILWEYDAALGHFAAATEVSLTTFPCLGAASCSLNYDLSVDILGHPHLFCLVSGGKLMDITRDTNNIWSAFRVDNQTLGGTISLHLARSQDGKYIFYSWTDNQINLLGRFFRVEDELISPIIAWTANDPIWANLASYPKTTNRVFETGSTCPGRSFAVPTIISDTLTPINGSADYYYFSNINYNCSDATLTPQWCYTCATNPINLNAAITNPICAQANGSIMLNATGGSGAINYQITTPSGGSINGNTASGLVAGNYGGIAYDTMGCISNIPIVLNGGSIFLSANANNVSCNTGTDGSIQILPNGGGLNYIWAVPAGATPIGNTATPNNLIAGNYICIATNGQCSDTLMVNIAQPLPILPIISISNFNTNTTSPYNGAICMDTITGGASPYTLSWFANMNGGTYYGDTACILNLPSGNYTLYVTDSIGCLDSATITMPGIGVQQDAYSNISFFKVFPNPTSDKIKVKVVLKEADGVEIFLEDVLGQIIWTKTLTKTPFIEEEIRVANFAKGLYFVIIKTSEGFSMEKIWLE